MSGATDGEGSEVFGIVIAVVVEALGFDSDGVIDDDAAAAVSFSA